MARSLSEGTGGPKKVWQYSLSGELKGINVPSNVESTHLIRFPNKKTRISKGRSIVVLIRMT